MIIIFFALLIVTQIILIMAPLGVDRITKLRGKWAVKSTAIGTYRARVVPGPVTALRVEDAPKLRSHVRVRTPPAAQAAPRPAETQGLKRKREAHVAVCEELGNIW